EIVKNGKRRRRRRRKMALLTWWLVMVIVLTTVVVLAPVATALPYMEAFHVTTNPFDLVGHDVIYYPLATAVGEYSMCVYPSTNGPLRYTYGTGDLNRQNHQVTKNEQLVTFTFIN